MNHLEKLFRDNKLTGENIIGMKVEALLEKLTESEFVFRGRTYDGVYVLGTDLKETDDGRYLDNIELDPSAKVEQSVSGIKDFWKSQYPPFKGDKIEAIFNSQIGDYHNEIVEGFLDVEEDGTPILLDENFNRACSFVPSYADEEIVIRKVK